MSDKAILQDYSSGRHVSSSTKDSAGVLLILNNVKFTSSLPGARPAPFPGPPACGPSPTPLAAGAASPPARSPKWNRSTSSRSFKFGQFETSSITFFVSDCFVDVSSWQSQSIQRNKIGVVFSRNLLLKRILGSNSLLMFHPTMVRTMEDIHAYSVRTWVRDDVTRRISESKCQIPHLCVSLFSPQHAKCHQLAYIWLVIPRSFSLSSHNLLASASDVKLALSGACCWISHTIDFLSLCNFSFICISLSGISGNSIEWDLNLACSEVFTTFIHYGVFQAAILGQK